MFSTYFTYSSLHFVLLPWIAPAAVSQSEHDALHYKISGWSYTVFRKNTK